MTGLPGYWTSIDAPNRVIKGYLDADMLIVTDQVVEAASRKALAILYDRQPDPKWRSLARAEHQRAEWCILGLVAQIDLDGDGWADLTINCGAFVARDT